MKLCNVGPEKGQNAGLTCVSILRENTKHILWWFHNYISHWLNKDHNIFHFSEKGILYSNMIAGSSFWSHTFINVRDIKLFEAHSGRALGLVAFEVVRDHLNNNVPRQCRLSSVELKGMREMPFESHTIVQVCMVFWIAAWHAGLNSA